MNGFFNIFIFVLFLGLVGVWFFPEEGVNREIKHNDRENRKFTDLAPSYDNASASAKTNRGDSSSAAENQIDQKTRYDALMNAAHFSAEKRKELEYRDLAKFVFNTNLVSLIPHLIDHFEDETEIPKFLETAFDELLHQDPDWAMNWFVEIPNYWSQPGTSDIGIIMTTILLRRITIHQQSEQQIYSLLQRIKVAEKRDPQILLLTQAIIDKAELNQAVSWVELLPAGRHQMSAISKVGYRWAQTDLESATEWMQWVQDEVRVSAANE